jgi:hypothetical protein
MILFRIVFVLISIVPHLGSAMTPQEREQLRRKVAELDRHADALRKQRQEDCNGRLAKLFPSQDRRYLGQGSEGVVYRVDENGKNIIAKYLYDREMNFIADDVAILKPLTKELEKTGMHIVEYEPTSDPDVYTYKDPPGVMLDELAHNVTIMTHYRECIEKVIGILGQNYELKDIHRDEDLQFGRISFTVIDRANRLVTAISFKPANVKYDPVTETFFLLDLK